MKFMLHTEQPQEVFYKKDVLKNFPKFTGKRMHQSILFNTDADFDL